MAHVYGISAVIAAALVTSIFFQPGLSSRDAYASDIMAEIGQPFSLGFNQTAQVKDVDVRFTDVIDSRCPSDVVCIWEGRVSILVHLQDSSGSIEQFTLTLRGSPEAPSTRSFGNYSIRLVDVQPYPVSTEQTSQSDYVATLVLDSSKNQVLTHGILVKARTNDALLSFVMAGWNVEKGKGTIVMSLQDVPKRVIVKFTPFYSYSCSHQSAVECIDGQVIETSNDGIVALGGDLHLEIEDSRTRLYLIIGAGEADNEYALDVTKFKEWEKPVLGSNNIVYLGEGQRDGPLLVQKIYPDRIEGLNFLEYPISTDQGSPVTLRIGEKASNGCTVVLTLVKIEDRTAVFVKTVDENKPCPICWLQTTLLSG